MRLKQWTIFLTREHRDGITFLLGRYRADEVVYYYNNDYWCAVKIIEHFAFGSMPPKIGVAEPKGQKTTRNK